MVATRISNRGGNCVVVLERAQQLLPHSGDLNTTTLPIVGSMLNLIGVRRNRMPRDTYLTLHYVQLSECDAL